MVRRRAVRPLPRKRPRQERATETVDAMLTAVEHVLEARGIAGLTTNRVAEVAGVSIGTLYQYFPNKQALVAALQERVLQQILTAFRSVLVACEGVPLADVARRMGVILVGVYRSQRPIHRWLIELRTAAAYHERVLRLTDAFAEELGPFLERAGLADPHTTAQMIVYAVEGVTEGISARPGAVDVAAIADKAVAMVVAYLATLDTP